MNKFPQRDHPGGSPRRYPWEISYGGDGSGSAMRKTDLGTTLARKSNPETMLDRSGLKDGAERLWKYSPTPTKMLLDTHIFALEPARDTLRNPQGRSPQGIPWGILGSPRQIPQEDPSDRGGRIPLGGRNTLFIYESLILGDTRMTRGGVIWQKSLFRR